MAYIGNVPAEKYTALTQQTFSSPTGTSFTLSQAVTNSVDIDLYIDNVKQDPASYSVSGTALTTSTIASPSTMYCIFNGKAMQTVNPPDDSVGLSQMASATDGNLITFDASGNPAYVATGSDGQVLTSTGAGSAPAFEALPAGGSWTLIGTQEASSDASLTQTGLNSTYDIYAVVVSDMVPASDNKHLWIRLGDSGGIDSGTDYAYHSPNSTSASASYGANPSAGDNTILAVLGIGSTAGEGVSGVYYLGKPADGTTRTLVYGSGAGINASGATVCGDLYASHLSVITHDRVQVLFSSGSIASGRLSVYGLSHT
jgi:hypothetical protein